MSRREESRRDSGLKQVKASPLLLWAQPESEQQLLELQLSSLLPLVGARGWEPAPGHSLKIQLRGFKSPRGGGTRKAGPGTPLAFSEVWDDVERSAWLLSLTLAVSQWGRQPWVTTPRSPAVAWGSLHHPPPSTLGTSSLLASPTEDQEAISGCFCQLRAAAMREGKTHSPFIWLQLQNLYQVVGPSHLVTGKGRHGCVQEAIRRVCSYVHAARLLLRRAGS